MFAVPFAYAFISAVHPDGRDCSSSSENSQHRASSCLYLDIVRFDGGIRIPRLPRLLGKSIFGGTFFTPTTRPVAWKDLSVSIVRLIPFRGNIILASSWHPASVPSPSYVHVGRNIEHAVPLRRWHEKGQGESRTDESERHRTKLRSECYCVEHPGLPWCSPEKKLVR